MRRRSYRWVGWLVALVLMDAFLLGWLWKRHRVLPPVQPNQMSSVPTHVHPITLPERVSVSPPAPSSPLSLPQKPRSAQTVPTTYPAAPVKKSTSHTPSITKEKQVCRSKIGSNGVIVPCPEGEGAGEPVVETRQELEAKYNEWRKEHHSSSQK